MAEGGFGWFDPDIEVATVGIRWKKYKARFENYMVAKTSKKFSEITAEVKLASLLHHVGERVFDMYESVRKPTHTYEEVIAELDKFFVEKVNVEYEKFIFSQTKQAKNEPFDAFVNKLRVLVKNCGYKDTDAEIKSRIIQGCYTESLRIQALNDTEMKLEDLINIGRNMELAKSQSSAFAEDKSRMVGAVGSRTFEKKQNEMKCGYCGKVHKPGPTNCPAKGKKCNKCLKLNHFSSVCKSDNKGKSEYKKHRVACVKVDDAGEETSDGYVYSVGKSGLDLPMTNLCFGKENLEVKMLIDTGCSLNIIDEPTYERFKDKPKLESINGRVYGFQNENPLNFKGQFTMIIRHGEKSIETKIAVVFGAERCLLGYGSAVELGLVKIINNLELGAEVHGDDLEYWKERYPNVFSGKLGNMKGFEIELDIDETVKPVYMKHERIPFNLRENLEEIVRKGLDDGVFEEAKGPTKWLLPAMLVPKSGNRLRFVIDASAANRAIKRTRYVLPTVEDLIYGINGARYFSIVDLIDGYHQFSLAKKSREITTFSTHFGLFRYKRLLQGINAAPEIFHRAIESQIIDGLEGARNLLDDILVYGVTKAEHNERLDKLFKRLNEKGLTVNLRKCKLGLEKVEFFGVEFSSQGIRMTEDKTKALKEASVPTSPGEVQSLLGLSTYCSRFIQNHAEITDPLRKLIRGKNEWKWDTDQDKALKMLKESATGKILSYYNSKWITKLVVDASPVGLGAILMQYNPNDSDDIRIVAYASRSLTDVERRYAQIEKECLAIVWGCEKFHIYLYGRFFIIKTDNKALEYIFKRSGRKTPLRIERWTIRLNEYDFKVEHTPGKSNPADYLSRKPIVSDSVINQVANVELYVNYIFEQNIPAAVTQEQVIEETRKDEVLQELIRRIRGLKVNITKRLSISYDNIFHELTVTDKGVVMRGGILVLPESLINSVIDLAHEGHQGFTKTKTLIRSLVWFPKLDSLVERRVRGCFTCQVNSTKDNFEPLRVSEIPDGPWQNLSIDFYGPTPSNTHLIVIICDYSRFALVYELISTASKHVIPILHEVWVTFGIPWLIKTDNGPPFNGSEFENFCRVFGIKHRRVTPYWPKANGEVEQFNRNLTKVMRNSAVKGIQWKKELNIFLGAYRSTPHSTTGVPPAKLIFKFCNTSKLGKINPNLGYENGDLDKTVKEKDGNVKRKMKEYTDIKNKSKHNDLSIDDFVLYRRPKGRVFDKKEPVREVSPWKVVEVKGSMITAKSSSGEQVTRNSSSFKKLIQQNLANDVVVKIGEHQVCKRSEEESSSVGQAQVESSKTEPRRSTRSGRGEIDKLQLNNKNKSYV
ncbi:unnamed protein product [Brachionus calyciflorus]|uniref:Reverse transcriptase n=1 Tax=Brachionus calyciflorus TaxID=104777 RepID=A0A814MNH3_9BILA|nr:unnamed protein product [Brachionus calyciflorus]